jgi:hypothetical protein
VAKRGTICRIVGNLLHETIGRSDARILVTITVGKFQSYRRRCGWCATEIDAKILRPIEPSKSEYVRKKPSLNLRISFTGQPL